MRLFDFLFGTLYVRTKKQADRVALLNLCHEKDIPVLFSPRRGEAAAFVCREVFASRLIAAALEADIGIVTEHRGLPGIARKIVKAPGLIVGALLGAVLLGLSGRFIWKVEIPGASDVPEKEILSYLEEVGLFVGAPIPHGSFDDEELSVLQSHDDVGWLSLSMKGTTLTVRLRGTDTKEAPGASVGNLVADGDGIIERINVTGGEVNVAVGDVVRKGDVLATGVHEGRNGKVRVGHTGGQIFAKRMYTVVVEIPFSGLEKVYTGVSVREKTVKFFAKDIKLFPNSRNVPSSCDIIYYESLLHFFGGESIPVGISTKEYREYQYVTVDRTPEEAAKMARRDLEAQLYRLSDRLELREKRITDEWTDTSYILTCRLVCVEDIAMFSPLPGDGKAGGTDVTTENTQSEHR